MVSGERSDTVQYISIVAEQVFHLLRRFVGSIGKYSGAGDINKAPIAENADIYGRGIAFEYPVAGIAQLGGDPQRGRKIVCGAERDIPQRRRKTAADNSGSDVVECPVAPGGDYQFVITTLRCYKLFGCPRGQRGHDGHPASAAS